VICLKSLRYKIHWSKKIWFFCNWS